MKICWIFLLAMLMNTACNEPAGGGQKKVSGVSGANTPSGEIQEPENVDRPPELPAFFLIADTGYNYIALRDEMLGLARKSHWPIDTLERSWKPWRDSILPIDSTMAYFNGDYFPRTHFTESMSVDYWSDFLAENDTARENKMGVLAGIYSRRSQADSALARLRPFCRKAFVYEGTMFNHEIH